MLGRAKSGSDWATLDGACETLLGLFSEAGAIPTTLPHLFAGETLLDLYGEDLRARAFLFQDAERGNELCLRPDFTVPVALHHGASGWDRPAAYAYAGPVFRRQPPGLGRRTEYVQAGVERFGEPDETRIEAETCALMRDGLAALGIGAVDITMGDLSIPFALLDALEMPVRRRSSLRRHVWRPHRFQSLIGAATAPVKPSAHRSALIEAVGDPEALIQLIADAGEQVAIRSTEAVAARLTALAEEAKEPRMPTAEAELIANILAIQGPAPLAASKLRDLTEGLNGGMTIALDRFEARLDALSTAGLNPATITFDSSFGRNLEYYDGMVFEMRAPGAGHHPPLAGGGRYNALTTRLGAPHTVPAIGGIIRPETVLEVAR